jgi:glycosyltransferase involved in cell wall biosynthesis
MISGDSSVATGLQSSFYYTLKEFKKHWDRIDIICPYIENFKVHKVFDNVYFYPRPVKFKILHPLFVYLQGKKLISQREYTLFTSHDYGLQLNGIGSWFLHKATGLGYVSEIMHVEGHPIAVSLKERFLKIIVKWYISFVKDDVLAFRVINKDSSHSFIRNLKVSSEKILVLYAIYIDFDVFYPVKLTKAYDIIFCARLAINKGILTLLRATIILIHEFPNIKLLIVGRGPLKQKIDQFIIDNNLRNNVYSIGWVESNRDLARLYNCSKILVCSSTVEGGPRVTIEAMACGVPVVTTPVGFMEELIKEGVNGSLFQQGDEKGLSSKITDLLKKESLYNKYVKNGFNSVQICNHQKVIEEYANGLKNKGSPT